MRRLSTSVSRGPLLNEVGRALVVGRAQTCAWVTRPVRIQPDQARVDDGGAQVALNDLARVLLGVKRTDRIPTANLLDRAKIPTMNELVAHQSAIAAWKAMNLPEAPLRPLLEVSDPRTRGGNDGLVRPVSARSIAATNMAGMWNASANLRLASTIMEAQREARKLAMKIRHN